MSRTASPRSPRASAFMTINCAQAPGNLLLVSLDQKPTCMGSTWLSVSNRTNGSPLAPLRRDVGFDLPQDRFLTPGSDHASLLLAVLEQDQGRDAHHAELPGRLRVVVHIQLGGPNPVGVVARDLLHHRRDHGTRDA